MAKNDKSGRAPSVRVSPRDKVGASAPKKKKRTRSRRNRKKNQSGIGLFWLMRKGFYWSVVLGLWAVIGFGGLLVYYGAQLPSTAEWAVPERPPNIKILDTDRALVANRGVTGGEAVRLDELPPYLPEAVLAIEDRRFYAHVGLDPIGLARAIMTNLLRGRLVQGGSTLTQQLAKNLFLTPERTFRRKMQEVVLAFWLETNYSKEEILELYLNRVYFGSGAYGVDAAARRYFNKSARGVTLAEAAVLAGLLKAPNYYSPARHPERANARAQLVLTAMHRSGFISGRETALAMARDLKSTERSRQGTELYVADWVMAEATRLLGDVKQDIIVDTTLNMELQNAAADTLRRGLDRYGQKYRVGNGAVVTLNTDGAVKALVGGVNYDRSQFNRALSAKRQPGSAFKPFVYLAALERGLTPDSMRIDQPVNISGWQPQNYSKEYFGPVALRDAISMSLNTVAASLTAEMGAGAVTETAERLGIGSSLAKHPSIALGTSEVTPLELTTAYVPFANGGYRVQPYIITRIRDLEGNVLYRRKSRDWPQVVASHHIGMVNHMLQAALLTGTGKKAALPGRHAAGKTGTSQAFRDAWFVGYTSDLVTGLWLGNDDNSPTKRASGGNLPATLWGSYMTAAHQGRYPGDLPGNYFSETGYVLPSPPASAFDREALLTAPSVTPRANPRRPRAVADSRSIFRPKSRPEGQQRQSLFERLFGRDG